MAFYLLLIFITCVFAVAYCEDCVYNLKHKDKEFLFDLISFKEVQTVNFTKNNDLHTINIRLCNNSETKSKCNGMRSKICLKSKNSQIDIGSKIKEMKFDGKNQLIIILEGTTFCERNKKHQTDLTFICNNSIVDSKIVYKSSDNCKHIIEVSSVTACPVDDLDIRKSCTASIPHSNYVFNLSPLRRNFTSNYLVENQNRRFEINICGRLTSNNKCGGNITTICDVTDEMKPKVYAVGHKNDQLLFDNESKHLKLIQHELTSQKKGRIIEIIFKCNESITPEKTTPKFLNEENHLGKTKSSNVAYFEVATSTVCIPRLTSCEIFNGNDHYNLKPLHKRVGNWLVMNYETGGKFYLNVCDYLNQYDEEIPELCSVDRKTSACYVNSSGVGISIGSSQIGPHFVGNSLILNYTNGENCKNSLKWSTVIYFTCSNKSELIHVLTDFNTCVYKFQWKSRDACKSLFERKNYCMVTHPRYSNTVYNFNDLKDKDFEVNDENYGKFRFSICSPLTKPCNGIFESAACFSINGIETNIGLFTEEIVFDNGKIYMSMHGEKCEDDGPNSYTVIRFVCDYSNTKIIKMMKDLQECFFEFFVFTKYACTQSLKINCTVDDQLGNIYDLSKLTKLNSNYEITINPMKTIILNVCHSVINNDINGTNCQLNSGVCLVDKNYLSTYHWYKNIGDVYENPRKKGNKILLEMKNGFYNAHNVSSVIEFICQNQNNNGYPVFVNEINNRFIFKWHTPLVCPDRKQNKKRETLEDKLDLDNFNNTVGIHPQLEILTELKCGVSFIDLTPLKGNYIVINKETNTKYYINMCMPTTKDNIRGIMEFNGKNYSIGSQGMLKIEKEGKVNVHLMIGDKCPEKSRLPMEWSTKIILICSNIEANPIFMKTRKKCALEFLWETSHVCNKIILEFNECNREAYIIGYRKDIENSKTINMKNILNTTKFFDNLTQTWFDVNFCNATVKLNNLTSLSLMNLLYDVKNNQISAYFKDSKSRFSGVNIIIECFRNMEDLSIPKVEITSDGLKINMYSKGLCCMDNNFTNAETCKNIPLANILTTKMLSNNTKKNELSINLQNYDYKSSDTSEESIVLTKENIEESDLNYENNNEFFSQYYGTTELIDNFKNQSSVKKENSDSSLYLEVLLMALLFISLMWFYRWKLLKEIRKLWYILPSVRRRSGNYNRNFMEIN